MKTAKATLIYMIDLLSYYLRELKDVQDSQDEQFLYGEKLAYTECLEILSQWKNAEKFGVPRDIEKVFPL